MQTTTNAQLGLLDSLMPSAPANEFLGRLDTALDWRPIERALQAMYPATTGRPPCAPLALFKTCLLQHCYGLSDPQGEELVADRLSWRRFVGLGLQDAVPDETTLVRFRQRLREHGLHERLLGLVNRQLQQKGLILKAGTLVDATLLPAARRAPAQDDPTGGDGGAGYTVKAGRPHYGYKAHVAVDQTPTLIRKVTLTAANVHDSREFETVVTGDGEMVMADKAYWSRARREWCGRHKVANGSLRKAVRGQPLHPAPARVNRLFSSIRGQIEQVFGWWQRSAGYRRVRHVGREAHRLELEFKSICWNLKRLATLSAA
jgi:IS5 family transposase